MVPGARSTPVSISGVLAHHLGAEPRSAAARVLPLEAAGRLHPERHLVPLRVQLVRVVAVPVQAVHLRTDEHTRISDLWGAVESVGMLKWGLRCSVQYVVTKGRGCTVWLWARRLSHPW